MSFFQPSTYPDGSFSTYQPVQPPSPHCSCSREDGNPVRPDPGTPLPCLPPPGPCPRDSPISGQEPTTGSLELFQAESERYLRTQAQPCSGRPISHRPCIPSHGPCPGPIPPTQDGNYSEYLARPIAISHSVQQGLPIPSAYPNSPPRYSPNSPPLYKPLSSPSEGTLLLAPPPSVLASTCPYLHPTSPSELPTHSCPHCHSTTHIHRAEQMDWMVAVLIILNFFVWGAVAYGYICEYNTGDFNWGDMIGSCVGGQGAAGWGRICKGEECRWAFVDC
ncbi:hypothetical protein I302_104591 [Kwoniella bestiolae CBS 10118]|uniref:LITAF domain-containing protein n=1 Tax=Kwoniella bestiolae CBS 10118 TaxID=1296100 RepID=A0A1B9GBP8_9TREE|nr:hypothetical protein I302_03297 [Kwoniella bestiolae CBS 10118]OCF28438.1 hypothetical protein I302_03297 [Kwoniella bestiolae CBS 10118]